MKNNTATRIANEAGAIDDSAIKETITKKFKNNAMI